MIERLCLGTAAFGLPGYRLSGRPSPTRAQALEMLEAAWDAGIRWFDTAAAYGDAEAIMGESGIPQRSGARVVTKIDPMVADPSQVGPALAASVARLGAPPHAVLFHAERQQHDPKMIGALFDACVEQHLVLHGVSVYDPAEADFAWNKWAEVVQFPVSPWDRAVRLATNGAGWRMGRGVFLRGLLLMFPESWSPAMRARAGQVFGGQMHRAYSAWLEWSDLSRGNRLRACLDYANAHCDRVVVGVGSLAQLNEVVAAARTPHVVAIDEAMAGVPRFVWTSVTGAQ